MIRTVLLTLALTGPASGADWTVEDTRWQGAVVALSVADWLQTRQIAKQPQKYFEYNPILGRHPSVGQVNNYFLVSKVLHATIAYALPPDWRRVWQYTAITVTTGFVIHNISIGLDIKY